MHKVHLLRDRFLRRRIQASAAGHVKRASARSIHFVEKVNEPNRIVFRRFQQNRACAIAEDHARSAIRVIDDRRHHVGADHQHLLVRSGSNKLRSRLQRVNERRTRRREIETPNVLCAQLVLHQTSRRREEHVGSNRSHDYRVQFGRLNPALGQRSLRRLDRQIAGRNPFVHDVPLSNANPFHDPLIVGIDHHFEVGVGEKARRNVSAKSADLNALKLLQ